ncbi:MAG: MurR/RpiR family transcriptional regulator [Rhodobacteraceae bacterium]|nr:MurR/RpiR family transcriptional regulator [Paracoccaceae bacterium]
MPTNNLFENILVKDYDALSQKLQAAADFVMSNPVDVATRSLRSISKSSDLAPATFSRLARALGYKDYEALRDVARATVQQQVSSFSAKASQLQEDAKVEGQTPFLARQSGACVANIDTMNASLDQLVLEAAVEAMDRAQNVLLLGALSSTGIVEYMAYLASYYTNKFRLVSRLGSSIGSAMTDLSDKDIILILTKPPFAKQAIQAAEMASTQGAYVIVITDTQKCPALDYADAKFVIPSDSPQFFSSYAATIVLIETMIGMLVGRAGPTAKNRISEVEARNHSLEEFWDP